jgi:ACS family sodium-dependent inorganic phosphate cotransporter-like MFS transporter 5
VFFVAAAIYVFGAIFYVIFGSGDLQEWAAEEKIPEEVMLRDVDDEKRKEAEEA